MKKTLIGLLLLTLLSACMLSSEEAETPTDTKTLYINSKQVDCTGAFEQKCLQIKESLQNEWTFFYDHIEGFEYKEGFLYTIKVQTEKIANPPQDASSIKYKLIEIIEKKAATVPAANRAKLS